MLRALQLAWEGFGQTYPNPPVGAVITRGGALVGEGYHRFAGGPHAEIEAIRDAGIVVDKGPESFENASMAVTLEPCSHYGKTGPCAERLAALHFNDVQIATLDPTPKVNGKGVNILRDAGVCVEGLGDTSEYARVARALMHPFWVRERSAKPYVIVKIAIGHKGTMCNDSRGALPITSDASRYMVHQLRAKVDAIAVGASTALRDNPCLDVRFGIGAKNPERRVLTRSHGFDCSTLKMFEVKAKDRGKSKVMVDATPGGFALRELAREGITSLLVEAGPTLFSAMLKASVVDELWVFQSPNTHEGIGVQDVLAENAMQLACVRDVGPDTLQVYLR